VLSRSPKYQPERSAIRDWNLIEDEETRYHSFAIPGILKVVSSHSKLECTRLLRAIVNLYINVRLQRQGVTAHWSRERKLLINYVRKENWEWQIELLDVARAYLHFENRDKHDALMIIGGTIVRFDSQIEQVKRSI
jgi:hypothetical protein